MRHFKHTLTFGLIPILAVFGIIGTSAKDVQPTFEVNHRLERSESNDIFHLESDDTSISLLFNASIRAYRHINKDTVNKLKDELTEAVKDIAKDQINLKEVFGHNHNNRAYRAPTRNLSATAYSPLFLLSRALISQFVIEDQVRASAVLAFVDNTNVAYCAMAKYFVRSYLDQQTSGTDYENAIHASHELIDIDPYSNGYTVYSCVEQVYNDRGMAVPTHDELAEIVYTNYCEEVVGQPFKPTMSEITEIYSVAQETIDDEVTVADVFESLGRDQVSQDIKDVLASEETQPEEIADLFKEISTEVLADVVKETNFTGDEMLDAIEKMGTSNLIEVAQEIGIDGLRQITSQVDDLDEELLTNFVIENVTARDMYDAVNDITINGYEFYQDKKIVFDELKGFLKSLPKLKDIRNYTDDQMRLCYPVILNTALGPINFDMTLGLFGSCENIRKIVGFIDDTFEFKKVDGKYCLWVKSPENLYKAYRWFCESDAFSDELKYELVSIAFSTVGEIRQWLHDQTLEVLADKLKQINYQTLAQTLSSAEKWNEILGREIVTDARIDKAIDGFFDIVHKVANQTFDKVKEYISQFIDISSMDLSKVEKLVNKVIELAKEIDEKHLDHEWFRNFLERDPDEANQSIYDNIDKYFDIYENALIRIRSKLLNFLDRLSNKYDGKSIMDYYFGDSKIVFDDEVTIGHDRILSFAEKHLPGKIYEAFKTIVDHIPVNIHAYINIYVPHVHSVKYMYDEKENVTAETQSKSILLPKGANASFFAPEIPGKVVTKWVYEDGSDVGEMLDADVVVYPVFYVPPEPPVPVAYEIHVTPESVDKVYNGEATVLSASVTSDPVGHEDGWSFKWYRKTATENVLVSNEAEYSVTNVADNGTYFCVASKVEEEDLISVSVVVNIDPYVIDVTGQYEWSADSFVYDGTEKSVELSFNPSFTDQQFFDVSLVTRDAHNQEVAPVEVGKYKTTATLTLKESCVVGGVYNYEFADGGSSKQLKKDWNITRVVYNVGENLSAANAEFVYDNAKHAFKVNGADNIPEYVNITYTYDGVSKVNECFEFEDVGIYLIKVKVSVTDSHNYGLTNDTVSGYYSLKITPAHLANDVGEWVGESIVEYKEENGQGVDQSPVFNLFEQYQDMVEVTSIEGPSEAILPGSYHFVARVKSIDPNYVLDKTSYAFDLTINKAHIELPELSFDDKTVEYVPGAVQSIVLMNGNIEFKNEHFEVEYFYDGEDVAGKIDVGEYEVTAKVTLLNPDCYELPEGTKLDYGPVTLKITPRPVPGEFNYQFDQDVFTYDGQKHVPQLSGYPEHVEISSVKITPNSASIDAGTYRVTYEVKSTDPNYEVPEQYKSVYCDYVINKAEIKVEKLEWDYEEPFEFDGKVHEVSIKTELPEGVANPMYSGVRSAYKAGDYVAHASISLTQAYEKNYKFSDDSVTTTSLSWKIVGTFVYQFESEQKSGDSPLGIVTIDRDKYEGLSDTYKLNVIEKDFDVSNIDFTEWYGEKEYFKVTGYSVNFIDADGNVVDIAQFNIMMKVKLFVPEEFRNDETKLFHLASVDSVELVDAKLSGQYLEFETAHFSDFVIMSAKKPAPQPSGENSNIAALVIGTGTAATVMGGFSIVLFAAKRRKRGNQN